MSLQNLFVAKLPRNITDADLMNIFSEFHPSSAKIMLDASTGKSKGFGFVLFDEEGRGEKAYKALNCKMTRACGHNFTLVIYPSNHNGKIFTEETNALYIRNIPMTVGQDRVERFLRTFGNLTYFAMREDHYGSPVWVIYAEYETVEDAKNALTKLHGNNTYFHGTAPILAKFEDSDDAKKERRRRREGAQGHVPSSGCIFPPPRGHHEGSGSLSHTSPSTTLNGEAASVPHSNGHGLENHKPNLHDTVASHLVPSITGGAAMSGRLHTPSPPSYVASVADVSTGSQPVPPTAFSMPQQLLQPTPGYCYTLADSGQQIFIPASSFGQPVSSFTYSPATKSAPAMPHVGVMPINSKPNFSSLLNPESNNAVVLVEGDHQYVVAPDAINLNREKLSTSNGMQTAVLSPSQPKSLPPAASNNVSYMSGSSNVFSPSSQPQMQSFVPSSSVNAPSPSFMVTPTSNSSGTTPMVFVPYNAS